MKSTILSRVSDTRRFYNSENDRSWLLFAGHTAWPNDLLPPEENLETESFTDLIIAKKASLRLVVPDAAGDILYYDNRNVLTKYREVTYANALTEKCTRILFNVTLRGSEFDSALAIRILAVSNNVVGSVAGGTLLANQVTSQGEIQALEYRRPLYLNPTSIYNVNSILEF